MQWCDTVQAECGIGAEQERSQEGDGGTTMTPTSGSGDSRDQTSRRAGGKGDDRDDASRQAREERDPLSRESAYTKEFSEAVGRTIKVIRTDLGMGRRELAEAVGISYSYLTEIENGNKPASSTVLRPIAHALGLRLSQLAEAAELRLEARGLEPHSFDAHGLEMREEALASPSAPSAQYLPAYQSVAQSMAQEPRRGPAPNPNLLGSPSQSAMRPSLRGPRRDLRNAVLELERLIEHMAEDDVERLLDFARRLVR